MEEKNYYKILNVSPKSDINEIKKAYKILAMKYHPDRNSTISAEKKFRKITEAYDVLSNPTLKNSYDENTTTRNLDYKTEETMKLDSKPEEKIVEKKQNVFCKIISWFKKLFR
ncbi:MAG: DnaJ domain-containing protein [Mycoplasmataceae bacterium]|nr:DnaJ domain-containing protein [Mycoplasmataceae bacterium]